MSGRSSRRGDGATVERRAHPRTAITCCVRMFDRGGRQLAEGRTVDLSDGGTFVATGAETPQGLPERVNVTLSVPRSTANTYMVEEVAAEANVLREQLAGNQGEAGLALQFRRQLALRLEV